MAVIHMTFNPEHNIDSQFHSENGNLLTQALFYEIVYDKQFAIYTLNKEPRDIERPDGSKVTLLPIKTLYLQMEDIPEYMFATTYFNDWDHWCRLQENTNLRIEIDKWRYELELKMMSKGMIGIRDKAAGGDRASMTWLAEKGWDKTGAARGRPKNLKRDKAQKSEVSKVIQGHFDRIQD